MHLLCSSLSPHFRVDRFLTICFFLLCPEVFFFCYLVSFYLMLCCFAQIFCQEIRKGRFLFIYLFFILPSFALYLSLQFFFFFLGAPSLDSHMLSKCGNESCQYRTRRSAVLPMNSSGLVCFFLYIPAGARLHGQTQIF